MVALQGAVRENLGKVIGSDEQQMKGGHLRRPVGRRFTYRCDSHIPIPDGCTSGRDDAQLPAEADALAAGSSAAEGLLHPEKFLLPPHAGATKREEGNAEHKAAETKGWMEGAKDSVVGTVKDTVGSVTGNNQQQAEGKAQAVWL